MEGAAEVMGMRKRELMFIAVAVLVVAAVVIASQLIVPPPQPKWLVILYSVGGESGKLSLRVEKTMAVDFSVVPSYPIGGGKQLVHFQAFIDEDSREIFDKLARLALELRGREFRKPETIEQEVRSLTTTYSDGTEATILWFGDDEGTGLNILLEKAVEAVEDKALSCLKESGIKGGGKIHVLQRRNLILSLRLDLGENESWVEASVLNIGDKPVQYHLPTPCTPDIALKAEGNLTYVEPKQAEVCIEVIAEKKLLSGGVAKVKALWITEERGTSFLRVVFPYGAETPMINEVVMVSR